MISTSTKKSISYKPSWTDLWSQSRDLIIFMEEPCQLKPWVYRNLSIRPLILMLPKELFKFLWKNKKDKIKRAGLYQDLDNGGIPMIDFSDIMLKNLKNSPGSRDC